MRHFFSVLLLIISLNVRAEECEKLLANAFFSIDQLDLTSVKKISSRGVFTIKHKVFTHDYVIRFQSQNDNIGKWRNQPLVASDIAFELFATKIAQFMGFFVHVNPTFKLSDGEAKVLLDYLATDRKLISYDKVLPIASVAFYRSMERATTVFRPIFHNRFVLAFQQHLNDLSNGFNDPNFKNTINWLWNELQIGDPTNEAEAFVDYLSRFFPNYNFHSKKALNKLFFTKSPLISSRADIRKVYDQMYWSISGRYMDSAAEFWAITNILGIPDADSYNALWDGKQFVGIDFAYASSRFLSGYQYPNNGDQAVALNPTGEWFYNPVIGQMFMDRLTDEFIDRLKMINLPFLTSTAKDAGLHLSFNAAQGMFSRINHFINRDLGEGKRESLATVFMDFPTITPLVD
jgi:hypothetical protein